MRRTWQGMSVPSPHFLHVIYLSTECNTHMNNALDMAYKTRDISSNRVDYCMDFLGTNFTLDPTNFITHPRVKSRVQNETTVRSVHVDKSAVTQSSTWTSVTLGKMPGRQVIIYDKRWEVIDTHKPFWFNIWNIDKADSSLTVDRVEIRAGKKELQKYNIRNLSQFKAKISDALTHAVHVVRHVLPDDNQSNVSRLTLHPLWQHVQHHVESDLLAYRSYESPNAIREVFRETKRLEYQQQILGNIAGYCACLPESSEALENTIPSIVRDMIEDALRQDDHPFWQSFYRAKERFVFLG